MIDKKFMKSLEILDEIHQEHLEPEILQALVTWYISGNRGERAELVEARARLEAIKKINSGCKHHTTTISSIDALATPDDNPKKYKRGGNPFF